MCDVPVRCAHASVGEPYSCAVRSFAAPRPTLVSRDSPFKTVISNLIIEIQSRSNSKRRNKYGKLQSIWLFYANIQIRKFN
jgi:hypothetical protein